MTDNRSQLVKDLCDTFGALGCRASCPLAKYCAMRPGDTKETFDDRMNAAAEEWKKGRSA